MRNLFARLAISFQRCPPYLETAREYILKAILVLNTTNNMGLMIWAKDAVEEAVGFFDQRKTCLEI